MTSEAKSSISQEITHPNVVIDPWVCIPGKLRRGARGLTDAHLSNRDGTELSEEFRHFTSLVALWLNRNR